MNQEMIVAPVALQHTNEVSCFPPWYVSGSKYPLEACTYQPLVNGEETFRAVHLAIAKATKSVDIICWGFQPSMFFMRSKNSCEPCIGELLVFKARQGVKVRLLAWEAILNSAGAAGEGNLPGKGPFRLLDRKLQHTAEDQYAYDRWWFHTCAIGNEATHKYGADPAPVFVTRGFSKAERDRIAESVQFESLDPEVSRTTRYAQWWTPSHHQKSVLVDYELPDSAVGFVLGHNMLDEYWDTDQHTALNRTPETKPAPNAGPRGDTPRQDISCQISGPILESLHHNFAQAWHKETGEDLLHLRQAMQVGPQLQCMPGVKRQVAQLLRTQPQYGVRDIEQLYLQAANNAVRFIYIENQYFRWIPLAELIKTVANKQTAAGRDPGVHGPLHLFVITNDTEDGMGKGTVNTQRMLESLGRADIIPNVTKQQRIQQVRKDAPGQPPEPLHPNELEAHRALRQWQADLDRQIKEVNDSTIEADPSPLLKVHICSLVAPDSPAGRPWMPVYIHSKLMIVDDVFTTHGSANINTRSMQVDSELNIAHEWADGTRDLRRRLWNLHTNNIGGQDDTAKAFNAWQDIINENKDRNDDKVRGEPYTSLVEFHYVAATLADLD